MYRSTGLVLAEKPSIGIEPTRLYDASRFKNHGTHTNITMVQLPSGLWVRSFAGDGFVNLGQGASLSFGSGDCAGGCWFKVDTISATSALIMKGSSGGGNSEYRFYLDADGKLVILLDASDTVKTVVSGAHEYDDNAWHLGWWARDGDNLRLIVDGVEHGNSPTDITGLGSTDQAADLNIGAHPPGAGWFLTGLIGLPKLARYAPSAGQIKNIYERQLQDWFI